MLELSGSSAIVTGGASGLGAATARLLAKAGCRVFTVDLNQDQGQYVADEIGGAFRKADVVDEQQVQTVVDAAAAAGPLRVLVNCAGIGYSRRTVDREGNPFPMQEFERIIRVNLIGTFNCSRLVAVAMSKSEPLEDGQRGVILNTASIAAFDGQIGQIAYSASKGGLVGMTLPMARDLAVIGVRVNTIAPGLIETPIYGSGEAAEQFKAKLASQCLLFPKRFGTDCEFATMAMELITNSYMNGETIRLDGGARMPPR